MLGTEAARFSPSLPENQRRRATLVQRVKRPCTTGWSGDSSFLHKRSCSRLVNASFALGSGGRITGCLGCGTAEPSAWWATVRSPRSPLGWTRCGLSELLGCGGAGRAAGGTAATGTPRR